MRRVASRLFRKQRTNMNLDQGRKVSHDLELPEALGDQSREERRRFFSRRALLEWSLPITAVGLAVVAVPLQAMAKDPKDHTDGNCHTDYTDESYRDHSDSDRSTR